MLFRMLLAEAIGTFVLTFTVGVSTSEPFTVGGALWAAMVATAFVSGAHFNPAITLSIITRKYINNTLSQPELVKFLLYMVVQFFSAFIASLCAWGIIRYPVYFDISSDYSGSQGFFAELIYTTILCANVLMIGTVNDAIVVSGGIIALTLTTGNWAIGRITGGCFNPAVGLGINLAYLLHKDDHFGITWLYIIAPYLGGIVGGVFASIFLNEVTVQKKSVIEKSQAE
ncbi:unnamed protein product [Blepharisma stoltei]|uniref:Aquaporin n=1 Tax=Blepharisma stoltei TaxID=1481888 RepID=A0AAU9K369_9CILI|nr:unnamed protein product [Blepharisma stoltei]